MAEVEGDLARANDVVGTRTLTNHHFRLKQRREAGGGQRHLIASRFVRLGASHQRSTHFDDEDVGDVGLLLVLDEHRDRVGA